MNRSPPPIHRFRKLPVPERQSFLNAYYSLSEEDGAMIAGNADLAELADVMIENAWGTFPLPFGLAGGFLIDGQEYLIPAATEEPSVIAAASYGALLVKSGGGFHSEAGPSVATAQIYLRGPKEDAPLRLRTSLSRIERAVQDIVPNLVARGGGFLGLSVEQAAASSTVCVSIDLDVKDAMGANLSNTVAEKISPLIQDLAGGEVLMAILTNACERRMAKARFEVPEKYLRRAGFSGEEVCRRIVEAHKIACAFPKRALTHNKGILNGVSALALATGNDTRAVEAAAHFHAQISGQYLPLTDYAYRNGQLTGAIEIPLPLGTVGGSISAWPPAQIALKILGHPDSGQLGRIAACMGLAQNFAALLALVTEGIQSGHMRLHAGKIAYMAGARGKEIRIIADRLWKNHSLKSAEAEEYLKQIRTTHDT